MPSIIHKDAIAALTGLCEGPEWAQIHSCCDHRLLWVVEATSGTVDGILALVEESEASEKEYRIAWLERTKNGMRLEEFWQLQVRI